ncbi:MAG: helix-turn-helix domain-containing protein [Pseudomonadota bacterium]
MIEQADFYVRMIAIGAGLMLISQIATGRVRAKIKLPVVALMVCAIAYLMNSTPLILPQGPSDPLVDLPSLLTPFFIWLFGRNLFEREPDGRMALACGAALCGAWALANFLEGGIGLGFYTIHVLSLVLMADLVRVALKDRADDLIEQRRLIRVWLPLLVAAEAGIVLMFELFFAPNAPPPALQLLNASVIFLLILFAGLALLRADPELLMETGDTSHSEDPAPIARLTPSEQVLHEKLLAAMEAGGYREPGLTIARLAARLATPEHRLRALINQRLGYRNFSAFLNRHRIAEAREKLTDKAHVDLPVLTIAMDLGYNSLPTFNRAFRAETGTTPSEFRRLGLTEA